MLMYYICTNVCKSNHRRKTPAIYCPCMITLVKNLVIGHDNKVRK